MPDERYERSPITPPPHGEYPLPRTADDPAIRWDLPAAVRRISWGAVLAAAVVALALQLLLNLLGFGIGMLAFRPASEAQSLSGFGVGTGIWLILTGLISLFVGGWFAGRLAGMPRALDGMLHGIVTWSFATLITFVLLTTAVGRIISGTATVVAEGLGLAGQAVSEVYPAVGDEVGPVIREELERRGLIEEVRRTARDAAMAAVMDPETAEQEVEQAFNRLATRFEEAADRESLVNTLVRRTGMSEPEARQTVQNWEGTIQDVRTEADTLAAQVRERAPVVAEEVTADIGRAAIWSFVILLFGAAAAALGGYMAAPKDLPATAAPRR